MHIPILVELYMMMLSLIFLVVNVGDCIGESPCCGNVRLTEMEEVEEHWRGKGVRRSMWVITLGDRYVHKGWSKRW